MERELVCIKCPIGCRLVVTEQQGAFIVSGNTCPRGRDYGISEVSNPTRIVTGTVRVLNADVRRLPVKTSMEIPKESVLVVAQEMLKMCVVAPICAGEVLAKNIAGTGANIVATLSIEKKKPLFEEAFKNE